MANENHVTIIGNLTADPELRFVPSGAAVANFSVAHTPRYMDSVTNEWKDGEALFLRCNAWRDLAENIANTFVRGDRVIVTGKLKQRSWETKEGEKRNTFELDVDDIGASVRFKAYSLVWKDGAPEPDPEPTSAPAPARRSSTRTR